MLSFLFAILASLCAWVAPPQDPVNGSKDRLALLAPIVAQEFDGADVWTLHADGTESLFGIDADGVLVSSFASDGSAKNQATQGPIGSQPVPTLRTSWCDALGVSHEVTTPIDSSTPAGIDRATDLHEKLVARLQAKHPPRPCPPP